MTTDRRPLREQGRREAAREEKQGVAKTLACMTTLGMTTVAAVPPDPTPFPRGRTHGSALRGVGSFSSFLQTIGNSGLRRSCSSSRPTWYSTGGTPFITGGCSRLGAKCQNFLGRFEGSRLLCSRFLYFCIRRRTRMGGE